VPAPRRIEDIGDARRLQLLIDGAVDYAIYLISVEGRILSWNSGAKRLKGYEADEILGQPFATFFSSEDRAGGVPERALAAAAKNGRFESEGWRVRKDGTRFWAMGVIDAIHDDDGELIAFAKVTRDMTERRLAEQRLMESERRFQRLVQAVVDYAIFQLDPNGLITTWNTGAQRIQGYTAQEAIGKHFSHFYTPEERDAGLPKRALETAAADGRYEAEGWRVRRDGRRFWASVVIDPIRDEGGELVGFAKITRDITERMESQRASGRPRSSLRPRRRWRPSASSAAG
jgi:PAS domain S-box-containing protein